jgi:hypothetical protein
MEKINIQLTTLQAAEISQFLNNAAKKIQDNALNRGRLNFDEKLFIDSGAEFTRQLTSQLDKDSINQILLDYDQAEEIHKLTNDN